MKNEPPAPTDKSKIEALRARLVTLDVDAFLLPLADAHQGENLLPRDRFLAYLTGFQGSAGLLVVTRSQARLFVDDRYLLRAPREINGKEISLGRLKRGLDDALDWLMQTASTSGDHSGGDLCSGDVIGVDASLHGLKSYRQLERRLRKEHLKLSRLTPNPVTDIWKDRPAPARARVFARASFYRDDSFAQKLTRIRTSMKASGASVLLVNDLASVAWLTDLRADLFDHSPLFHAYALIEEDDCTLFIDAELDPSARKQIGDRAKVERIAAWRSTLARLARSSHRILIDPNLSNAADASDLAEGTCHLIEAPCPIATAMARKSAREAAGMRAAALRDGRALCRFIVWNKAQIARNLPVSEGQAAKKIDGLRAEEPLYFSPSFATISAFAENGALPHHQHRSDGGPLIHESSLYLFDSGAHYRDGTTDVTRVLCFGAPTPKQKLHYTLVLKGLITLTLARFPAGVTGAQLDSLARMHLWSEGLDYGHGTGHGVGAFSDVHQGPAISPRSTEPISPGMICSNEPAFYLPGAYGIRLENLILAREEPSPNSEKTPCVGFDTLTLAPFERNLIDVSILSPDERAWLNAYHHRVFYELSPMLDEATCRWLAKETQPLEGPQGNKSAR